jgi:hypothetical protein
MWSLVEKLATPFYAIVERAAKRKVEEIAVQYAVKQAILRELIRLRFEAYVLAGKLDPDRALGLGQRVIDELLGKLDLQKADPEANEVRSEIGRAVVIKAINTPIWVVMKELVRRDGFDPKHFISVDFRDKTGNAHHSSNLIAYLQNEFLFHKPFAFLDAGRAKVSQEVRGMAEAALKGEEIELISCTIQEMPNLQWPPQVLGQQGSGQS